MDFLLVEARLDPPEPAIELRRLMAQVSVQ